MHSTLLLSALSGLALVSGQTTSSLPPTIQGANTYNPPGVPGYTGPGGNASISQNNPKVSYQAVLPNRATSGIRGSIVGAPSANGTGILFTVGFVGFPSASLGPFVYHIHNHSLSADGNCTTALGHLDPTLRGESPACYAAQPQTCQVGDLAGKHGNITVTGTTPYNSSYLDLYVSADPSSPAFFGDKSIVIHSANTTRLTCANFTIVSSNTTVTSSPTAISTVATFTGAAATNVARAGVMGAAMGLAAFLL